MGGAASIGGDMSSPLPTIASFRDKDNKLVSKFTKEEEEVLRKRFTAISDSASQDGITESEFICTLTGCNPETTNLESLVFYTRMFKMFDANGDGKIDFDEFIFAASLLSDRITTADKMIFLFKIYDVNDDNAIASAQVSTLLNACVKTSPIQLSPDHIDLIVKKTFNDAETKNGCIEYNEFKKLVKNNTYANALEWMDVDILGPAGKYASQNEMSAPPDSTTPNTATADLEKTTN